MDKNQGRCNLKLQNQIKVEKLNSSKVQCEKRRKNTRFRIQYGMTKKPLKGSKVIIQ